MSDKFDDEVQLQEAAKRYEVDPIMKRFGAWVVTTYGIECLEQYYPIELSRVSESDWVEHMGGKMWVEIGDFSAALAYAKVLYATHQRLSLDGRSIKIFLCHGSEDKPAVRKLRHCLLAIGTDPWLDEEKMVPG